MIGSAALAFGLQTIVVLLSTSAFVIACFAHRRTAAARTMNLRVLVERDMKILRDRALTLKNILERSGKSNLSVAQPSKATRSPMDREKQTDLAAIDAIVAQLPRHDERFFRLKNTELESKLVEIHGFSLKVAHLQAKHRGSRSDTFNIHRKEGRSCRQ